MTNTVAEDSDYRNAMIDAVCYWMGYQFKIGREQLIHEASLRYPVADTITSKGVGMERIVLEQLHPLFKSKKIDLVVFAENTSKTDIETNDAKLREVFEFKLAKSRTGEKHSDEHQRVFDDLARLAYYNHWGGKDCYFLMCGTYEDFKSYFVGQGNKPITDGEKNKVQIKPTSPIPTDELQATQWKPEGIYKNWFGFRTGETKEITFKNNDDSFGLKPFQNSYHIRDTEKHIYQDTINISTTCITITPAGLENIRTHAAGIWKIKTIHSTIPLTSEFEQFEI